MHIPHSKSILNIQWLKKKKKNILQRNQQKQPRHSCNITIVREWERERESYRSHNGQSFPAASKQNPSCLHGCECTTVIEVHPEHTGAGSLMAAPLFPRGFTPSAKWKWKHNERHVQHIYSTYYKERHRRNPHWKEIIPHILLFVLIAIESTSLTQPMTCSPLFFFLCLCHFAT